MEIRNLTCISCPMGCQITVEMDGKEVMSVTGNTCKRGDVYARKEVTNPTRIVTSTVKVIGERRIWSQSRRRKISRRERYLTV